LVSTNYDFVGQYSDSLRAGQFEDRIPVEARISAPVQTGPMGPPSLLYSGYWVYFGGKAKEAWR